MQLGIARGHVAIDCADLAYLFDYAHALCVLPTLIQDFERLLPDTLCLPPLQVRYFLWPLQKAEYFESRALARLVAEATACHFSPN